MSLDKISLLFTVGSKKLVFVMFGFCLSEYEAALMPRLSFTTGAKRAVILVATISVTLNPSQGLKVCQPD